MSRLYALALIFIVVGVLCPVVGYATHCDAVGLRRLGRVGAGMASIGLVLLAVYIAVQAA